MAGIIERAKSFFVREGGKALVQVPKSKASSLLSMDPEDNVSERVEKFQKLRRSYERVPLITAIIDVQADQTVQNFYFDGPNSKKLTEMADKVNLMRFFHRITKSMLLYGNAYVEIVKKGKEIEELKIINPIWMDTWRKDTGEVIGFTQIISGKEKVLWGSTGKPEMDAKFEKRIKSIDSIAHFKYNVLGSEKYGRSIIAPVLGPLQAKLDIEMDLAKVIHKYVAPLIWAKVGNDQFPANDTAVSTISSTLNDLQAESEVTTSHLVDLQVLDFNAKGMDIKTPVDYMDQQIITGGQTPPVLLGMGGENKAEAEVQLRAFGRHIKAIQRELKYEFEDNIIVKQGIGNEKDKLVWERSEEREWESDVDIIRGLVTDGILTPQKANDLLPERFNEELPDPTELNPLLNQNSQGPDGVQIPRDNQMKNDKVKDNPKDPTMTTKDKKTNGSRVNKTDREIPVMKKK